MLCGSWETIATTIANMSEKEILPHLEEMFHKEVSEDNKKSMPIIFVGRDTREHSRNLSKIVTDSVNSISAKVLIR